MSKISKYANLPYIAWDEPEVYETPDLPEADQEMIKRNVDITEAIGGDDTNEGIQIINIDAKKSFEKFSTAECGDYLSEPTIETPLQQYKRLDAEVTSLAQTLEFIQKTREERSQDFGDILADITQLEAKLRSCKLAIDGIPLELQLQPYEVKTKDGKVTKKVDINPLTKITSIENRIKRLENLLDHDDDQLTCIYYYTNERSLGAAVRSISSKVSLLDSSTLDQLDHRVSALIQKLNQLNDKKSLLEESQSKSRINELYEMVSKSEKSTSILYELATRLNILAEVEEEALNFSSALTMMESKTESNDKTLQQLKTELSALKSSFQNLEQSFEKQMDKMDKRIDALK